MNKIGNIELRALEILDDFPIHRELPASLSGKYHIGETQRQHLELAVNVCKHLCDEFNVQKEDRDMLIATTWLHDIGLYIITQKGDVKSSGWKYYKITNYSRLKDVMQIHGTIGACILDNIDIPRKQEIQKLIRSHMSHWYSKEPQPNSLYAYIICIADYVASRGNEILDYKK